MFQTDMAEKSIKVVEITDIEPSVFKNLLSFISRGKLEFDNIEDLLKLYVAADKYIVSSLACVCRDKIMKKLTPNCVTDAYLWLIF